MHKYLKERQSRLLGAWTSTTSLKVSTYCIQQIEIELWKRKETHEKMSKIILNPSGQAVLKRPKQNVMERGGQRAPLGSAYCLPALWGMRGPISLPFTSCCVPHSGKLLGAPLMTKEQPVAPFTRVDHVESRQYEIIQLTCRVLSTRHHLITKFAFYYLKVSSNTQSTQKCFHFLIWHFPVLGSKIIKQI